MTRLELASILENRVGWKQPTDDSIIINEANLVSESGRYFQDEHAFVKVSTIIHLMETINATSEQVNDYLTELKKRVVLTVVDESFIGNQVNNVDVTNCVDVMDAAISKRMAMKIGEILNATTRSNRKQRIAEDALKMFFFDVNGDPNFPNKISISEMYKKELDSLKDMFNTEKMLDVYSLGNNRSDLYERKNRVRFI